MKMKLPGNSHTAQDLQHLQDPKTATPIYPELSEKKKRHCY